MSISIEGGRAEQNAVRKSYQVQVASFGGNDNDTCTFTLHIAAINGQFRYVTKFLGTLRNLMSFSL